MSLLTILIIFFGYAQGLLFAPYKDITTSMNWNDYTISTSIMGKNTPLLDIIPSNTDYVIWAFATGECGKETWAGVSPIQLSNNIKSWSKRKPYVISTGGANGIFSCKNSDEFKKFISNYFSSNMVGIDFDIEQDQSTEIIDNLIKCIVDVQADYPILHFSFTIATLGGDQPDSLNTIGSYVVKKILTAGIKKYSINLMTMDYGVVSSNICTLKKDINICDMEKSSIQAAKNLNAFYGVPFYNIDITIMIGQNDIIDEFTSLSDWENIILWSSQNNIRAVHFWSIDRDQGLIYTKKYQEHNKSPGFYKCSKCIKVEL